MAAVDKMHAETHFVEIGLRRKLLEDLALKTLYVMGELTLRELSDHMQVNMKIVEEIFQRLRKEQLLQVTGMVDGIHRVVTTSEGKVRALELLSQSQYTGAAPVTLDDYVDRVEAQTVRRMEVHPAELKKAFAHLVIAEETLHQLGTASVSGKAIFLHGPPGTGKTTVAETLWQVFNRDPVWVPHAVEVDGQIITVYDPHVHERAEGKPPTEADGRWVLCKRPRVMVGGELTVEMLDLQYNPSTRYYAAPLQMKANNGLLIVDDFGRQRIRPEELLNRWVVPLDRNIDILTLAGGKKIEVPFDMMVAFATNLDPATLVDEAFLRRIQTKIRLDNTTPEDFHEICRRVCEELNLQYDSRLIERLVEVITAELNQPLRNCYPRDLMNQICWAARYAKRPPELNEETLTQACRNYFLAAV